MNHIESETCLTSTKSRVSTCSATKGSMFRLPQRLSFLLIVLGRLNWDLPAQFIIKEVVLVPGGSVLLLRDLIAH